MRRRKLRSSSSSLLLSYCKSGGGDQIRVLVSVPYSCTCWQQRETAIYVNIHSMVGTASNVLGERENEGKIHHTYPSSCCGPHLPHRVRGLVSFRSFGSPSCRLAAVRHSFIHFRVCARRQASLPLCRRRLCHSPWTDATGPSWTVWGSGWVAATAAFVVFEFRGRGFLALVGPPKMSHTHGSKLVKSSPNKWMESCVVATTSSLSIGMR
jgi:hypothetical protein